MEKQELKPAIEKWLDKLAVQDEKSENTIKQYTRSLNKFAEFIESAGIETIDKKAVLAFKNDMLEEIERNKKNPKPGRTQLTKVSTVNLRLITVNKFLKESGEPDAIVKLQKTEDNNVLDDMLSEKEYNRILEWADRLGKKRIKLIIETLAGTGIRISELKAITVESLKTRTNTVTNKGKTRTIFIPKQLAKKLRNYCKENNITEGIIFHGKDKNKIINQTYFRTEIKGIAGKARGIKRDKVHAHAFRHLFAKRYANMTGANPYVLPLLLGHSTKSLPVTFNYTKPSTKELLKAVDELEAYYSNKGNKKK